jgi:alcohol dehydrogenase (NADP+)
MKLPDGNMMPVAAYGTFHSDWAQDYMYEATIEAIRIGWRHIDTARTYENESDVGDAIKGAICRDYISSTHELFITGKLWNGHMSKEDVKPALENTLKRLGVDKIDLYLNHWLWPNIHIPGCAGDHKNPNAVPYIHEDFMKTWGEIVKLKRVGKIVNIGTSNHTKACMKLLLRDCSPDACPVVNQMEVHPLFQQTDLIRYFQSEWIILWDIWLWVRHIGPPVINLRNIGVIWRIPQLLPLPTSLMSPWRKFALVGQYRGKIKQEGL